MLDVHLLILSLQEMATQPPKKCTILPWNHEKYWETSSFLSNISYTFWPFFIQKANIITKVTFFTFFKNEWENHLKCKLSLAKNIKSSYFLKDLTGSPVPYFP